MQIDLFYFDGCPFWQQALDNLYNAWAMDGYELQIHLVKVKSSQEAKKLRFQGSPSFAFKGQDFWPEQSEAYSTRCRNYQTPLGLESVPTVEMLKRKLLEYQTKLENKL